MKLRILYLLAAFLLIPAYAHAAQPDPVDAGISGECYDLDGTGGEAEVEVEDGTVYNTVLPSDPTNPTGSGAAAALLAFLNDPKGIPGGNACTAPGDDHLEVHAFVAGVGGAEVCYDGASHPLPVVGQSILLGVYDHDVCDDDAEVDSG